MQHHPYRGAFPLSILQDGYFMLCLLSIAHQLQWNQSVDCHWKSLLLVIWSQVLIFQNPPFFDDNNLEDSPLCAFVGLIYPNLSRDSVPTCPWEIPSIPGQMHQASHWNSRTFRSANILGRIHQKNRKLFGRKWEFLWGYPSSLDGFWQRENPRNQWMRTGGSPIYGNPRDETGRHVNLVAEKTALPANSGHLQAAWMAPRVDRPTPLVGKPIGAGKPCRSVDRRWDWMRTRGMMKLVDWM